MLASSFGCFVAIAACSERPRHPSATFTSCFAILEHFSCRDTDSYLSNPISSIHEAGSAVTTSLTKLKSKRATRYCSRAHLDFHNNLHFPVVETRQVPSSATTRESRAFNANAVRCQQSSQSVCSTQCFSQLHDGASESPATLDGPLTRRRRGPSLE
jgi:hypothetical protein